MKAGTSADANPPYGKKSNFRKISLTLPQSAYQKLIAESARRKIAREPNQLLSALLREAVAGYLSRVGRETGVGGQDLGDAALPQSSRKHACRARYEGSALH